MLSMRDRGTSHESPRRRHLQLPSTAAIFGCYICRYKLLHRAMMSHGAHLAGDLREL